MAVLGLDPVGALIVAGALVALVTARRRAARAGARLGFGRTLLLLLGIALAAAALLGFPGADARELRVAFVLKVTLLLVVAPTVFAGGRPIALLEAACGARGRRRIAAVLRSRPVVILGNAAVAPLVPLAALSLLLTPVSGVLRTTWWGESLVDVLAPLAGLAVAVPLAEPAVQPSTLRVTAMFLIGFVELVADAIPGILLRLATTVLDGVNRATVVSGWHISPLRDQQLAGDLLWCIAEAADVPALALLLLQWLRSDRRDAAEADELTDEEFEAAAAAHLRRR